MSIELFVAAIGFAVVLAVVVRRQRNDRPSSLIPPPKVGSLEADRATLRALRAAGGDLTKSTEVDFYLYFPTREGAEAAARQAETSQLAADVQPAASGDAWLCMLSGDLIPTETAIHDTSVRLQGVAAANGGEYDGWEARVSA